MYHVLLASVATFFDSTAEIPFMFKKAGCLVDILCTEESWLRTNRFHDKWIKSHSDPHLFSAQLQAIVKDGAAKYDWVVLLEDITVKLLNEADLTEDLFKKILPLKKIENREILASKTGLSIICARYGIDTPGYVNYNEEKDLAVINSKIKYPVLLKVDHSFAGTGIQYCEDATGLEACIEKAWNKDLIIQEFIRGEDIGVEALFKDGQLIMYNAGKVLTYMYNQFSFTTRRLYFRNEALESCLETLGNKVGINGFASINYIYHPERNIYYLIEVDIRTNSWMPYGRFIGNSFTDGIKSIIKGKDATGRFTVQRPVSTKAVELAIFDRDIRRIMRYRDYKGLRQWLTNYKGFWRLIPIHDNKLFSRIIKKMFKDLAKRA